ncbi:MAG: hypothetical protein ACLRZZ_28280 [Enterocloster sp.]
MTTCTASAEASGESGGMVNVFRNAVNDEDVSMAGLERVAGTMGIRFI